MYTYTIITGIIRAWISIVTVNGIVYTIASRRVTRIARAWISIVTVNRGVYTTSGWITGINRAWISIVTVDELLYGNESSSLRTIDH